MGEHLLSACPQCGHLNDLFADGVPEHLEVNCSSCSRPMGKWADLQREQAPPTSEPPRHAN
jgi:hypothetical protein